MCEALISVWHFKEYNCNLVKFAKLSGDHLMWRKTYELLIVWLRPVLDGVPKNIAKNIKIERSDEKLLEKYFANGNDLKDETMKEEKNENNSNVDKVDAADVDESSGDGYELAADY